MSSIDWESFTAIDHKQRHFFTCISELGLQQLVIEPTLGNNILDLLLVDDDRVAFDVNVIDQFGGNEGSDHQMISFKLNFSKKSSEVVKTKTHVNYEHVKLL